MLKAFSITDIGRKRQLNEDYVCAMQQEIGRLSNLFIVADGMGGHKAGDHASKETVERMLDTIAQSREGDIRKIFSEALQAANEAVYRDARRNYDLEGMGTTVVACTITPDHKMHVVNVGDSRLYVIHGDEVRQITEDHSLVEEMVRKGILAKEKARNHPEKNIITRAVGVTMVVEPDYFQVDLQNGDHILMCSDGLSNMIEDEEMSFIVNSLGSLEEKAKMLVDAANGNGGRDNISVILIDPFAE